MVSMGEGEGPLPRYLPRSNPSPYTKGFLFFEESAKNAPKILSSWHLAPEGGNGSDVPEPPERGEGVGGLDRKSYAHSRTQVQKKTG